MVISYKLFLQRHIVSPNINKILLETFKIVKIEVSRHFGIKRKKNNSEKVIICTLRSCSVYVPTTNHLSGKKSSKITFTLNHDTWMLLIEFFGGITIPIKSKIWTAAKLLLSNNYVYNPTIVGKQFEGEWKYTSTLCLLIVISFEMM